MLIFLQLNNYYAYQMNQKDHLSVNIHSLLMQELSEQVVSVNNVAAAVEMAVSNRFFESPNPMPLYEAIKEVLLPVGESYIESNIRPKILLGVEHEDLYRSLKKHSSTAELIGINGCVDRVLAMDSWDLNEKCSNCNSVDDAIDMAFDLCVEKLTLTLFTTMDLSIVNLNDDDFFDVKHEFKSALSNAYNTSELREIHQGSKTVEQLGSRINNCDRNKLSNDLKNVYTQGLSAAYKALASNETVNKIGNLRASDKKKGFEDSNATIFTAHGLQ